LADDAFLTNLNTSAQLIFNGLNWQDGTSQLLKNGVRCDDNSSLCNVSYNASAGILYANVSGFSNYSTNGTEAPNVVCGDNITSDLVMNTDLVCTGAYSGLNVTIDNVTLDCNGHSLTGDRNETAWGIVADSRVNITVKDCVITNYTQGVSFTNTSSSNVTNNTVYSNSQSGIQIWSDSDSNIFSLNVLYSDGLGGFSFGSGSDNNTIVNNTIYEHGGDNADGIGVQNSNYTNITGNIIYGTTRSGIVLSRSNHSFVVDNIVYNNSRGIWVEGSATNNTITNNYVYNNSAYGFDIGSVTNHTLSGNNATDNSYGIIIADAANNIVSDCIFSNNTIAGMLLSYLSSYNNITDSTFDGNAYGILLADYFSILPANNTYNNLFRNNITNNVVGIYNYNSTNNSFINNTITGSTNYSFYSNVSYTDYGVDSNINVSSNYWGMTGCSSMNSSIYDGVDVAELGNVTFSPLLNASYPLGSSVVCSSVGASCGETIISSLTLTGNLSECNGTGIGLGADNIILDCGGYSLIGNGTGNGVSVTDYLNITITGCEIVNFSDGVRCTNTNNSLVHNNTVRNNTGNGIILVSSFNDTITNNVVHNNTEVGIFPYQSDIINISSNIIFSNQEHETELQGNHSMIFNNTISNGLGNGLTAMNSLNNTITYNNIYNMSSFGMSFVDSFNNTLSNNLIYNSTNHGFMFNGSDNNNITNNNVTLNNYGIFFLNSSYNRVSGGNLSANTGGGVGFLDVSTYNNITDLNIQDNVAYGITFSFYSPFGWIADNDYNSIFRNNITGSDVGINVVNSTNNTFTNNSITNSGNYSFYNNQSDDVNASSNYWGSTNCTIINASIYDGKNSSILGNVTFVQFLNASYPSGELTSCPEITTPSCGDGTCNGDESCSTCVADCGACSSSSSGGGGGGDSVTSDENSETYSLTEGYANQLLVFWYYEEANPIRTISFITPTYLNYPSITISFDDILPAYAGPLEGTVYKYITFIESANLVGLDLTDVTINFTVSKGWYEASGLNYTTTVLHRFDNDTKTWQDLVTILVSENSTDYVFSAASPGLSLFAVDAMPLWCSCGLPSSWSACYDDTQSRIGYDCGDHTSGACIQRVETRKCAIDVQSVCGNGVCESGESYAFCSIDCPMPDENNTSETPFDFSGYMTIIIISIGLIFIILIIAVIYYLSMKSDRKSKSSRRRRR
ncbi:MAG: right-handed parallel beta-helix repeat-containing protein, partial [Candidatus Aenigmatarchaeota archaeon]